jgi:hypothetical protein
MYDMINDTVYIDTDEDGTTQGQNLANICRNINSHGDVDLAVSVHFNASNGDGHGVEVWAYDNGTDDVANRICDQVAALGYANRGVKYTHDLYVLRNTRPPAILVECCFCDNQGDADLYNADSMARAIVAGLTGQTIAPEPASEPTPAPHQDAGDPVNEHNLVYQAHSQNVGWLPAVRDGQVAGTTGYGLRLEALRIDTSGSAFPDLRLRAQAHIQNRGWTDYGEITPDTVIGTVGEGLRMEALELDVIDGLPDGYKLMYQVHLAESGWTPAIEAGYTTGTVGIGRRIEAARIWIEAV